MGGGGAVAENHTAMSTLLDSTRTDFDSGVWSGAYQRLMAADREEPLGPELGDEPACVDTHVDRG